MFKEIGKKISDSNDRQANQRKKDFENRQVQARKLADGLNLFLLENKDGLESLLKAARGRAQVKVNNRSWPSVFKVSPGLGLLSETTEGVTKTVLIGYSDHEGHYQPQLSVEVHRHIAHVHSHEDGHYVKYFLPNETGIEAWPYPNGYTSDAVFVDELLWFNKIPTIEKVKGDLAWQARKLSWKFK
jgi:hypothetical protein